ncbi:MAG: multiheme c-type cytochrome [Sulfuricaulis sp.]|nr:multiheme c-type cytochrome [Sulfuricaulis sp.]
MRGLCSLLLILLPALAMAGEKPPAGQFTNAQCLSCHASRDAKLIAAWRASNHARTVPKADCVACHGTVHAGSLARARRDSACVGCHEKLNRAVVHSYATSKHGVLMRLEEAGYDWSQPLARGNYRAPGCAYCHLHAGEHDVSRSITPWVPLALSKTAVPDAELPAIMTVCGDCHAPRYIAEQAGVGARMLDIARMKLREAHDVVAHQRATLTPPDRAALDALFGGMQTHARNVRLGTGHQSPDYQWWHGQPALDGDLLRIKGVVAEQERRRLVERARITADSHSTPGQR